MWAGEWEKFARDAGMLSTAPSLPLGEEKLELFPAKQGGLPFERLIWTPWVWGIRSGA